ncbi:chryseobasin-related MNIO class RiPP peptide [Portibacter marinus]|uniref:chryseobasin-related MNIO class RiPP peptide n=1 Tax=Portibacter marinus TaxID=2898660 RepID=UPI001F25F91F|nr:hypothetical protein [Portibacter marinus]
MKLSKSILSAMAVGIALGTTSCSLGDVEEIHYEHCALDCEEEHTELRATEGGGDTYPYNCPACGMG